MITSFSLVITLTPRSITHLLPHRPSPVRQIASEKMTPPIPLAKNNKSSSFRAISNGTLKGTTSEEEEEEEEEEEDIDVCPVDCVTEFKTEDEFQEILEKAKGRGALVVVDFYRTSCGSCKYIEQLFKKMCKGAADEDADVLFLKHNVISSYYTF
jgi:Thioredoxin